MRMANFPSQNFSTFNRAAGIRQQAVADRSFKQAFRALRLPFERSLALLAASALLCACAAAQSAHVTAFQTFVGLPNGTNGPFGVAVDSSGNIYLSNEYNNNVVKETPAPNGGFIETVVAGGLVNPYGIAVDQSGAVYITVDSLPYVLKETPSGSGYTATHIGSGMNSPANIAVDTSGNVYVADWGTDVLYEEKYSNGGYTQSIIPTPGVAHPLDIAVDQSGNLYIGDGFDNIAKKFTSNGMGGYTQSTLFTGNGIESIAVDAQNNVYIGQYLYPGEIIAKLTPTGNGYNGSFLPSEEPAFVPPGYGLIPYGIAIDALGNVFFTDGYFGQLVELSTTTANFGDIPVGGQSFPASVFFTFDSNDGYLRFGDQTQGYYGLDFTDAGTGTCFVAVQYFTGESCTMDVTFSPTAPGARYGAAALLNSNNSVFAAGYLQGAGVGPAVGFPPGTQSTIIAGLASPGGIAVDPIGNIYYADTTNNTVYVNTTTVANLTGNIDAPEFVAIDGTGSVFIGNNANGDVFKETPSNGLYNQSPVVNGIGHVTGVAVDGFGNVYVADTDDHSVYKEAIGANGYTQSTVATGIGAPQGVAVDGAGNVYIADAQNNDVIKETLAEGNYTQSTVANQAANGLSQPAGVAVDPLGNVYIADAGNKRVVEETLGSSGYVQSVVPTSGLSSPFGVVVDALGNLYVTDRLNGTIVKLDISDPPSISFPNTAMGSTSSQQTVTLENLGNAPLTFPAPFTGSNPSIAPGFLLASGNGSDCPLINSGSPSATLAAGATCLLPISFEPNSASSFSGSLVVTDTALNAAAPSYATQTISLNGAGIQGDTTSTTTKAASASLYSGQSQTLSATVADTTNAGSIPVGSVTFTDQFGATINSIGPVPVNGNGVAQTTYTPAAGTHMVTSSFTPANPANFAASADNTGASFTVMPQVTPTLSLNCTPNPVSYQQQLSCSATVSGDHGGTIAFTLNGSPWTSGAPDSTGTVTAMTVATVSSGTISISANYSGDVQYAAVGKSASVTAQKATPTVTWASPAAISYGTALNSTQLDASSATPGSFAYTPIAGTVLGVGSQTLSVIFTPTDNADYNTATQTVQLTVNKTTPTVNWTTPAAITYGAALSSTQLDASSAVAGSFAYAPTAGTILTAGSQTLSVTFTPTDTTDYSSVTQMVQLTVNKATPTVNWTTPAAITYGTALSSTQLDANSLVAGSFAYTPTAGTVLTAGSQTLSVTFTPNDATDYNSAAQTVQLTVNKATPTVNWATPAAITYGTALSSTQLDANSAVAGSFAYTPTAGTMLGVGSQTLSVTFTPNDSTDYNTATQTVQLTVNKATPTVNWATPAAITYGTALSSTQLDANSAVAGSFSYTPTAGTVLTAGSQTLSVTFTPTDTTDYNSATQTVQLTVNKATPTVNWATPAAITYGTALSSTQLDANSAVAGSFAYTPTAGTVLTAGSQTLSVTFTPADATDYNSATQTVQLTVNKATPTVNWTTPAAITYGTALGSTQLDANSLVAGSFAYTPTAGTVLTAGSQTLSVTFTPTDTIDYSTANASVMLAVNNPVPALNALMPVYADQGGAAFTLTVNGSGFTPSSVVYWGATPLTTQFGTTMQLTAQVTAADIATAGTPAISIVNPAPGGGASNSMQFEVVATQSGSSDAPDITALNASVTPGSNASYPVMLPSGVTDVSAMCLNLPAGATCSYSSAANAIVIATSSTTPAGTYQITVIFTETVPGMGGFILLPLLLLPLMFARRRMMKSGLWLAGLALILLVASFGAMGCGGSGASSSQPVTVMSVQAVNLTVQ
jgi:DNA-binding beta-propeller fold protein YncE